MKTSRALGVLYDFGCSYIKISNRETFMELRVTEWLDSEELERSCPPNDHKHSACLFGEIRRGYYSGRVQVKLPLHRILEKPRVGHSIYQYTDLT